MPYAAVLVPMNTSPQSVAQSTPVVSPVAVIGATGKTGRRVAAGLEARRITVRRLSRTSATPFLWEEEGTWEAALEASSAAYVAFHPTVLGRPPTTFSARANHAAAQRVCER